MSFPSATIHYRANRLGKLTEGLILSTETRASNRNQGLGLKKDASRDMENNEQIKDLNKNRLDNSKM